MRSGDSILCEVNRVRTLGFEYEVVERLHGFDGLVFFIFLSLVIGIVLPRSLFQLVLASLCAPLWFLIGHVGVGLSIVVLRERNGSSFPLLANEYAIGFAIAGIVTFLVCISDAVFARLLMPVPVDQLHSDHPVIARLMNSLLSWPGSSDLKAESFTDDVEESDSTEYEPSKINGDASQLNDVIEEPQADWRWKARYWFLFGVNGVQFVLTIAMSFAYWFSTQTTSELEKTEGIVQKIENMGFFAT